jgi:ATP-binding cassette, subfamily B, heavy metal transporter
MLLAAGSWLWVVPVGLLLAYGLLRLSTTLFTELRELVFAKATEGATRAIALQVFGHLHALSLRFHLERQTGGMTRDIERGTRGVQSLISYSLYSILPTLLEVALVLALLGTKFDMGTSGSRWARWCCTCFHRAVTEWRTQFRRQMNEAGVGQPDQGHRLAAQLRDRQVLQQRGLRGPRYDEALEKLRLTRIKSQTTLSMLNAGQQLIIATALVAMLWRATQGVAEGA